MKKENEPTKQKHPGGRPTKYTPEVVNKIVKTIEAGNYAVVAAKCAGIAEDTFYDWLKNKPGFSELVKKAESGAERESVDKIRSCQKGWQAHAWWLERKFPERWGRDRYTEPKDTREKEAEEYYSTILSNGKRFVVGPNTDPVSAYHEHNNS